MLVHGARGLRAALTGSAALSAVLAVALPMTAVAAETAVASGPAVAQAVQTHTFEIPPQDLADALVLLGHQAGVQVSARGEALEGHRAGRVSGTMTLDAALTRLLSGTGLVHRLRQDGTVAVEAPATGLPAGGAVLDPVRVETTHAATGVGAVAGDVGDIAVSAEALDRRNPSTLKEVFAGESGVSVGGGVPLSQKVYVRGVEETNLAVTIDGARQNNKVFHHTGTNLIDPGMLKAVRVDPGVAPADAGPGALGGAITYEVADPRDLLAPGQTLGGFVSGSYDTNGETATVATSAYGQASGFEVLGYLQRAEGDDYEAGNGKTVDGTGADLLSGLAKLAYETPELGRLEVSAQRVRDDSFRPFRANIGALPNRPDPTVRRYDMERNTVSARYDYAGGTGLWDPSAVVAYSGTVLKVPEPYGSEGTTESISGRVDNTFHLTDVDSVVVGLDFYNDTAAYDDPSTDVEETARNVGVFSQARLEPLQMLSLSFGLRGDKQWFEGVDGTEIENTGLSGNVSAAVYVNDHVTLSAGYSNVWGGIALAENYILNPDWSYDGSMTGVRAQNLTAGVETQYEGFTFGAHVFRSDFTDARDESYRGGASQTADFETRGYTLSAGYDWQAGFVEVSFTDSEIEVEGSPVDTDLTQYFGAPLGQVFAVEAAHRFDSIGLLVGGRLDAALENTDTEEAGGAALPAYEVVSLYTEYQPAALDFLTLRLEANNVFDESYADRATYGQDFASVEPLREQGRSFLLKAKAEF